jgi:hypothetical protein
MRNQLHTLLPGQFSIVALFVVMTVAAVVFAVVIQPVPVGEKIISVSTLCGLFWIWQKRNYLHPLQGTISFELRRRIALVGWVGSVLVLPLHILIYAMLHGRRLSFVDVVFGGAVLTGLALETCKLIRASRLGETWVNMIEV